MSIKRKQMTIRAIPIYRLSLCTYRARGVPQQAVYMPDGDSDATRVILGMVEWLKQNNATSDIYYLGYPTQHSGYEWKEIRIKPRGEQDE